MKVSYTKLKSGNWGLRSDKELTVGSAVAVTKKGGGEKQETVGTKVWTDHKTAWLYAIESSGTSRSSSRGRGERTGCSCGSVVYADGSISDNACWTCRHDNE